MKLGWNTDSGGKIMTAFSSTSLLAALLLISLPAAGEAMKRFSVLNSACQTASNAVWQAWLPSIRQAIESGDSATAGRLACQGGKLAWQACENATRSISGLLPPALQQAELARAQAITAMLAHGMTPCN
jgi:hypothetical protein